MRFITQGSPVMKITLVELLSPETAAGLRAFARCKPSVETQRTLAGLARRDAEREMESAQRRDRWLHGEGK